MYDTYVQQAISHIHSGNFFAAIVWFEKAIALDPASAVARVNKGLCLFRLNLYREAIIELEKANVLDPALHEPHMLLGMIYASIEEPKLAEYHFRSAVVCGASPSAVSAYLAPLLKGVGNWGEGFDLERNRSINSSETFWSGEDLTGKSILFFLVDGWGDKILSLRYLNFIKSAYKDVRISVATDALAPLIQSSFPDITVGVELTDYAGYLSDVPRIFKLGWKDVPRPDEYLYAGLSLSDTFRRFLYALPKRPNVGLCWASFAGPSKTIQPWEMFDLSTVPVNFISLQKPYRQAPKELELHDWTDALHSWGDTAALINELDLVISIDTGVAHLAGALGKPVWCIVRHSTYWPWLDASLLPSPDYSIWYPSMKLYRQRRINDWLEPVRQVTLDLYRYLATHNQ